MSSTSQQRGRDVLVDDLSRRLVALRKRAGMTQQVVADAMGKSRTGRKVVGELERRGLESACLLTLAEYLRAVRAGFRDLKDVLDTYTSLPVPAPQRKRAEAAPLPRLVTGSRALACLPGETGKRTEYVRAPDREEELRVLRMRRHAGYWTLRRLFECYLHTGLKGASIPVHVRFRRVIATYARRFFNALYRMHRASEGKRAERLARLRASAKRYALPPDLAELAEALAEFAYKEMREHDELDWMPPENEARSIMLVKPKHRVVTDAQMCHAEWNDAWSRYASAAQVVYDRAHKAALEVADSARCDTRTLGRYRQAAMRAANIARGTAPDTPQRRRSIAEFQRTDWPPELDRKLLGHILNAATSTGDALFPTLPPPPGPRPV